MPKVIVQLVLLMLLLSQPCLGKTLELKTFEAGTQVATKTMDIDSPVGVYAYLSHGDVLSLRVAADVANTVITFDRYSASLHRFFDTGRY